jgi:hypothetical protein
MHRVSSEAYGGSQQGMSLRGNFVEQLRHVKDGTLRYRACHLWLLAGLGKKHPPGMQPSREGCESSEFPIPSIEDCVVLARTFTWTVAHDFYTFLSVIRKSSTE